MSTAYRTRRVDGADEDIADTLRELHELTFGDTAPQVSTEEGHWWITYLGKEPVAFCGLVPSIYEFTGYFKRVGVLQAHRGHGLQRHLMSVFEKHARRLGWTHIVSDTTDNIPSANCMIKSGYTLFAPAVPWSLSHALYWRKKL